jgi:hypothetical protein
MIQVPKNPDTENDNRQESSPMCQRESCIHKGTKYSEATRRCTMRLTQEITLPDVLHGLHFPSSQITVDLCVTCYGIIKHDMRFQFVCIVGIGSYAGM